MYRKDREAATYRAALLASGVAGIAAAAGQVWLLRELLTLFAGLELAAGLLFASWLLWGAAGSLGLALLLSRRKGPVGPGLPALLLSLAGLALPLSVLLARAARQLWGVPTGVQPDMGVMLHVCLLLPGVFCLPCGALFAAAWRVARQTRPSAQPLTVYLADALGAAIGGALAYIGLLLGADSLLLSLLLWGLCLSAGVLILRATAPSRSAAVASGLGFLLLFAVLVDYGGLERWSRSQQWGADFLAARETLYQSLALTERQGEYTLFGGGGWMFTIPDQHSDEWGAHPPLLVHPRPRRVLLLGGNPFALAREILLHPSVERLVVMSQDRELFDFLGQELGGLLPHSLRDLRVTLLHQDPVHGVRHWDGAAFDVVLLHVGEPVNAGLSRYYSLEFFRALAARLAPGGVVAFGAMASPEALGPAQEAWIRSLQVTAAKVFPEVRVLLGAQALFLAFERETPLPSAKNLAARAAQRGLDLTYVREDTLSDLLSPFKQAYVQGVLEQPEPAQINTALRPVCYFNSLMLWAGDFGQGLQAALLAAPRAGGHWLWLGAAAIGGALALLQRKGAGLRLLAATAGGGELLLQLSLVLAFQSLAGSLYGQLALLVGAYMAGLGGGAWLVALRCATEAVSLARLRLWLLGAHGGLIIALLLAGPVFEGLLRLLPAAPWLPTWFLPVLFTLLSLGAGILGGGHFSLAVTTLAATQPDKDHGAALYGLDLLGAALASLLASLLLLPLYGLGQSCVALALLLLGSGAGLAREVCRNFGRQGRQGLSA